MASFCQILFNCISHGLDMSQSIASPPKKDTLRKFSPVLLSLLIATGAIYLLSIGVKFMRNEDAPEQLVLNIYETFGNEQGIQRILDDGLNPLTEKLMIAVVALVLGVGGVWVIFWVANDLVSRLTIRLREKIHPYVFIGPAILLLSFFLIYPTFNTIYTSFTEDILKVPETIPEEMVGDENILLDLVEGGKNVVFEDYVINLDSFELAKITIVNTKDESKNRTVWLMLRGENITTVGLKNYVFAFTSDDMKIAFRNNLLWLVIGTGGSVVLGLLVATLVDKIKREALAKTFIFMPLAISLVGASVIWRFVYAWQPAGKPQTGILNAIMQFFGNDPIPWILERSINNYALIIIMIWLQTGFCMVVLSAALKGVPTEVIEAARIDGANEYTLFFRVIIPIIRGSILTVTTTVFIAILKVFDIVYVMTSGKHDTEVIANRMFVEMFQFFNFGNASALAVVLLIVVIPIMALNIRNLRRQGINQ